MSIIMLSTTLYSYFSIQYWPVNTSKLLNYVIIDIVRQIEYCYYRNYLNFTIIEVL